MMPLALANIILTSGTQNTGKHATHKRAFYQEFKIHVGYSISRWSNMTRKALIYDLDSCPIQIQLHHWIDTKDIKEYIDDLFIL
jgi:hypothetical protein